MVAPSDSYSACSVDDNVINLGSGTGGPQLESCVVLDNGFMASNVAKIKLLAPYVAQNCRPGQFVHLKLPDLEAHILRRPFSVYAADANSGEVQLLYQAVGQGTEHLTTLSKGTVLNVIGPIGRGWQPPENAQKVLLVGGGLGSAPLYLLAASFSAEIELHMVMGAQNAEMLVCQNPFLTYIPDERLHITTDDGSVGRRGFTTAVAKDLLEAGGFDYVATCGPEPMQRIVAQLAAEAAVRCEVSLERRMACGVGACLGCMVHTTAGPQRACVDGPVFNAAEVIW